MCLIRERKDWEKVKVRKEKREIAKCDNSSLFNVHKSQIIWINFEELTSYWPGRSIGPRILCTFESDSLVGLRIFWSAFLITDEWTEAIFAYFGERRPEMEWFDQNQFLDILWIYLLIGPKVDGWVDKRWVLRRDIHQDCDLELVAEGQFQFSRKFATCDPRDYRIEASE